MYGENSTRRGVRNFIRAARNPIFGSVNRVVAVDGTGTDVAQESVDVSHQASSGGQYKIDVAVEVVNQPYV